MDIYSSSKKSRHAKKKPNILTRIRKWFAVSSAKKKSLVIALVALILVFAILAGIVLGYIIKFSGSHDKDFSSSVKPISKDITNIALFGIDTRDTESFEGRSDSIMILSLNKKTGSIKVISVMRDSLVKIDKDGTEKLSKINNAYAYGGPELAVKTLNKAFGLDIAEYATVNFAGMADIIDAVGGIMVNVLPSELNATLGLNDNLRNLCKITGETPEYVEKAGYQELTGRQAVAWARIRSVATEGGESNDFGRTDRQRYVMEQLLDKVLNMKVTEYPDLINKLLPYVKTSLSFSEIVGLSSLITKDITFEESRVPHNKYIINANYNVSGVGSSVYYSLDYAAAVLHAYIYDGIEPEDYMEQNGIDKTGWHGGGSSGGSTTKPSGTTSQGGTTSVEPSTSSDIEPTESEEEIGDTDVSVDQTTSEETSSDSDTTDEPTEDVGGEVPPDDGGEESRPDPDMGQLPGEEE